MCKVIVQNLNNELLIQMNKPEWYDEKITSNSAENLASYIHVCMCVCVSL